MEPLDLTLQKNIGVEFITLHPKFSDEQIVFVSQVQFNICMLFANENSNSGNILRFYSRITVAMCVNLYFVP